jgi:hypothetical protein
MQQRSLASQSVFEKYGRKSRRELFLDEMEQIVPWAELLALVEPHYAKAGNGTAACGPVDHAAYLLRAAVVQPVRPRRGRGVIRVGGASAVRWRGPWHGSRAG